MFNFCCYFPDDVFLPKDVDPTEMDEIDREVEYFKRYDKYQCREKKRPCFYAHFGVLHQKGVMETPKIKMNQ